MINIIGFKVLSLKRREHQKKCEHILTYISIVEKTSDECLNYCIPDVKFNCVYLGSLRVDKKIPLADTGKLFELVLKASAMQDL